MTQATPGWYTDPSRVYSYRYWDGMNWTNQVSSGGTSGADPNPLDPAIASTPPAPGSAAPTMASTPPPPTVQVSQKSGSGFGTIVGVILAILVVVALIAVVANNSGDDSTDNTDAPVVTEAPETPGEE